MRKIALGVSVLGLGLSVAACSSGVEQAKQEMADSCFSSGNGRLTESECSCMADVAFKSLSAEERDFVDKLYSMDRGIPDSEAAEQIGMEQREFDRLSRNYMRTVQNTAVSAAQQCVGG